MMRGDTTRNMYSSVPEKKKLCNVASCWKYIKRDILTMHGPLNEKKEKKNACKVRIRHFLFTNVVNILSFSYLKIEFFSFSALVVSVFRVLCHLYLDINVIRVTINPTFIIIISFHVRYLTCEGLTLQYLFIYLFGHRIGSFTWKNLFFYKIISY